MTRMFFHAALAVLVSLTGIGMAHARSCTEQSKLCADHARNNATITEAMKQKAATACVTTNLRACLASCKRAGGKPGNHFSGYGAAIGFPQFTGTYPIDECR